jgi:hypothetical protein
MSLLGKPRFPVVFHVLFTVLSVDTLAPVPRCLYRYLGTSGNGKREVLGNARFFYLAGNGVLSPWETRNERSINPLVWEGGGGGSQKRSRRGSQKRSRRVRGRSR